MFCALKQRARNKQVKAKGNARYQNLEGDSTSIYNDIGENTEKASSDKELLSEDAEEINCIEDLNTTNTNFTNANFTKINQ